MPLASIIKHVYCSDIIDDGELALFQAQHVPPDSCMNHCCLFSISLSRSTIDISDSNSRKSLFSQIVRNYTIFRITCQSYNLSDSSKESRHLNLMWVTFSLYEMHMITHNPRNYNPKLNQHNWSELHVNGHEIPKDTIK